MRYFGLTGTFVKCFHEAGILIYNCVLFKCVCCWSEYLLFINKSSLFFSYFGKHIYMFGTCFWPLYLHKKKFIIKNKNMLMVQTCSLYNMMSLYLPCSWIQFLFRCTSSVLLWWLYILLKSGCWPTMKHCIIHIGMLAFSFCEHSDTQNVQDKS